MKKVLNDTEVDICEQSVVLDLKVKENLDMIETILDKKIRIPSFQVDLISDKHEPVEIRETKMLFMGSKSIVKLRLPDSIRCKGQMATFGSHALSVSDLRPSHVVRFNEKGKLIAKYYPEIEADQVIGVNVFNNKIYIVQEKGITVIHTRTNGKDKNMFYQLQLHKDSKICVIDDSNMLFTSPVEGSVYLYNIKDNTTEVMVNNLNYPTYLSTSRIGEGRVYLVTERNDNLIKVYDNEWKLLNKIGDKDHEFNCPQATVITEMGTVLVCQEKISHFRLDGTFLSHVLQFKNLSFCLEPGLAYKYPHLWASRTDSVWFAELKKKKILKKV